MLGYDYPPPLYQFSRIEIVCLDIYTLSERNADEPPC